MKRFLFVLIVLSMVSMGFIVDPAWVHAERYTVGVPMANVRSGPGTNYKTLWKLEKNHPVETVAKSGDWYQFRDFEGDKGWIYGNLLKKKESVIVKKDRCNVRSGPGTNYKIIFNVEKGVPFLVLERKGSWIHIKHADGDTGWIHKMLVW